MKAAVVVGHLKNETNEGTLLRSAEAFGINQYIRIRKIKKTGSQGAERHMILKTIKDWEELIEYARTHNHTIVTVENTSDATYIDEVKRYPKNPIFVFGHEANGVPKIVLDNARMVIQIRQGNGYIPCLNVSVCAGIIFYDFFRKSYVGVV